MIAGLEEALGVKFPSDLASAGACRAPVPFIVLFLATLTCCPPRAHT